MPDIVDLVEPDTFEQPPPRQLPAFFLLNLLGEHLLERPLRAYLSPLVLGCLVGAVALAALGLAPAALALLAIAAARLLGPSLRLLRDVREDYLLARHGQILTAHILGTRDCRDRGGALIGSYIDCAVPLSPQRTSVSSVFIADPAEAARLSAQGRLAVICLAGAPGAWRLYRKGTAKL